MHETWLSTNRRALAFGCIPPALIVATGLYILLATSSGGRVGWMRWPAIALIAVGALAIIVLAIQFFRPRIAFRNGHVTFYLRTGAPIAVPIAFVEAFLLGQGPANLPGGVGKREKSVNLVAKLSQREASWANRKVKPSLGQWKDGYITIRGTWCEPLDTDVIRRLNRRLREVQQMNVRQ